jgi:hypothetical protein
MQEVMRMATAEQIRVRNRLNGMKSKGPKTVQGKEICAHNAEKHGIRSVVPVFEGFTSRTVVYGKEGMAVACALAADLRATYAPVGILEQILLDRLGAAIIRLMRLHSAESREWESGPMEDQEPPRLYKHFGRPIPMGQRDPISLLVKYEAHLDRVFYRALHELQRLQATRLGVQVPLPDVMDVDINLTVSE